MAKTIIHKQVYRKGALGGTVNTTLCGRMANAQWDKNDGMNVSDDVTCKLCLRIAADPKHWRNRNLVEG